MQIQYAHQAWAEIISKAAVSPLGISALGVLVVGFVILALVRRDDTVTMRIASIVLLLLFCGGLVLAAFYNVQPTVARPEQTAATQSQTPPSAPAPSPPPSAASTRVDCGTAWSPWIEVGGQVGNPCPSGCSRGGELGQSFRVVGFPPRPETQHKFQCWRG
jgi:hypothetical protein